MAYYGYEYFCGANVIVEVEGFPILESAGISVSINESKRPIYGYSSRFFDAVARGQVLVQGSLLVNYVHQDYLYRAVQAGITKNKSLVKDVEVAGGGITNLTDAGGNPNQADKLTQIIMSDWNSHYTLSQTLKDQYWGKQGVNNSRNPFDYSPNLHDVFGGLSIQVTFGERNDDTGYLGDTGFYISDVYFLGRGQQIQIDENVIMEEYTFFGRNMYPLRQATDVVETVEDGESTISIQTPQDIGLESTPEKGKTLNDDSTLSRFFRRAE